MILVLLRFWFILEFWCTFWEALLLTHAYRVSQNFHFCACLGENVDLFDFFFFFLVFCLCLAGGIAGIFLPAISVKPSSKKLVSVC